jgi:hypothetical protein
MYPAPMETCFVCGAPVLDVERNWVEMPGYSKRRYWCDYHRSGVFISEEGGAWRYIYVSPTVTATRARRARVAPGVSLA